MVGEGVSGEQQAAVSDGRTTLTGFPEIRAGVSAGPVPRLLFGILLALSSTGCGTDERLSSEASGFAEAEANGFDREMLASAYASAGRIEGIKSLLVSRSGVLVTEEYFGSQAPDSLHDVRSVTKSVTSILVGIAIDKGYLQNVDQPIVDYLGSMTDAFDADRRKITIRHLLSMCSGFRWAGFGDWSDYGNWRNAADQGAYVLGRELAHRPGEQFTYNDAACHLLSIILSKASGMDTRDFADRFLFGPLGIGHRPWAVDKQAFRLGSVGLYLSAQDMVKLGRLCLQNGTFDGHEVVSEQWVATSTAEQISTGLSVPYGSGYGYLWWVDRAGSHRVFYANGYGGQFIFVVPDLELVVTAACTWTVGDSLANENWGRILNVITKGIVPAVRA